MQTAFAVAFGTTARKSLLPFTGAIIPNNPTFDKVAACEIVGMHCVQRLSSISFHNTNEFSDEEIQAWEKDGVIAIDVGSRKYHGQVGSATEWVVNRYCISRTPGVQELIELINKNNGSGFLKQYAFSVVALIRKLYELEDSDEWRGKLCWAAGDVAAAFVKVGNGDVAHKDEPMEEQIAVLAKQFAQDSEKPLTLGQYVKHLWLLGENTDAITKKLAFWQDASRRLKQLYDRAKAEWDNLRTDAKHLSKLEFRAGPHRGIILRTNSRALVNVVTRDGRYTIRFIVESDGHTTIATNRLDISKLHEKFDQREPKQWHYNAAMGALLNGGPQYTGVKPTRIPSEELLGELKQLFAAAK